jgi:putative endonuclease
VKTSSADSTRTKGIRAESVAAQWLEAQGYCIVEKNFTCKLGEIDLIARHGGELVFVEVRSRHWAEALDPVYSVDFRKRKKIIRTAQVYLSGRFVVPPACRFDVVIVTLGPPLLVQVIADAFCLE